MPEIVRSVQTVQENCAGPVSALVASLRETVCTAMRGGDPLVSREQNDHVLSIVMPLLVALDPEFMERMVAAVGFVASRSQPPRPDPVQLIPFMSGEESLSAYEEPVSEIDQENPEY